MAGSCGAQTYHAFTCTRGPRLENGGKACHRYGFWRTKVVLRHPKRLDLRETLPLLGLALIFILPQWWIAPLAYGIVILLAGAFHSIATSRISAFLEFHLLIILHTAFTLGLFDGLVRMVDPATVHNAQTFIDERNNEGIDGKTIYISCIVIHTCFGFECLRFIVDPLGDMMSVSLYLDIGLHVGALELDTFC